VVHPLSVALSRPALGPRVLQVELRFRLRRLAL
jgi:hypothetical protein